MVGVKLDSQSVGWTVVPCETGQIFLAPESYNEWFGQPLVPCFKKQKIV
jgi:hypothetical protein